MLLNLINFYEKKCLKSLPKYKKIKFKINVNKNYSMKKSFIKIFLSKF